MNWKRAIQQFLVLSMEFGEIGVIIQHVRHRVGKVFEHELDSARIKLMAVRPVSVRQHKQNRVVRMSAVQVRVQYIEQKRNEKSAFFFSS